MAAVVAPDDGGRAGGSCTPLPGEHTGVRRSMQRMASMYTLLGSRRLDGSLDNAAAIDC